MKRIKNKGSTANWFLASILVICLILIPSFVQGKGLTVQEVRFAVQTWVRYVTADARPEALIEKMEPHVVDGDTLAYIAHITGGGFCLCGANDLVLPVYFYSPQGTYDPQNPNFKYILWEIKTRFKCLQEAVERSDPKLQLYQQALSDRSVSWQDLSAGRIPVRVQQNKADRTEPVMMALNLTTHWHQGSPYNNACPLGDQACTQCPGGSMPSSRTVVGCVATAAAQIMKYWNWPPSGVESDSFWWDGDDSCDGPVGAGNQFADFSDAYDWVNMPDDCESGCTQAQQDALAELCYEAGVAVSMDWGVCGSEASTEDVDNALEDYFRYDGDATYGGINIYTMTQEIQWLRPLQYRATDPLCFGHSWVVYGYDKSNDPDREFRMNFGWGGVQDGWYVCDEIDVLNANCQQISDDILDLVEDPHHVTRIAPENVVKFVGASDAGDGSPDDPYENIEEAIVEAPDGATLIFKAGSNNTFSAPSLVINRPFTLRGYNAVIQ